MERNDHLYPKVPSFYERSDSEQTTSKYHFTDSSAEEGLDNSESQINGSASVKSQFDTTKMSIPKESKHIKQKSQSAGRISEVRSKDSPEKPSKEEGVIDLVFGEPF